ncbi:MAG: hypothetical protein HC872_08750 [Gammaproteobacteria bacterium]|nr:hypothetical protein [Gammaproteobacteria bacterium]
MTKLTKISLGTALVLVVAGAAGYVTFKVKNPPPQLAEPDYYAYYLQQDMRPEGKVGVLITQLIMPEDFRLGDYHNIALKSLQYIPWPIRNRVPADRGVALLDPERFYEFEPFTPTRLEDVYGNDNDVDGVPYIEKFARGEVTWVPPSRTLHLDHGYFLLTRRHGGMPTMSAKLANKARVYYHGKGWVGPGKLPHEAGMRAIVEKSMARIQEKYGPLQWRFTSAEDFGHAERVTRELLDSGVQTLVMAPAAPIYSHHEEFNGSFKHAMHYVHEWEKEHGKQIKVIFTRQLGDFDVLREAYLTMLRERLDTLPPDAAVKVAVSIHGMAWERVPHEAWLDLAPKYRDGMVADARRVLEGYPFPRKEVVLSQDHFADPINDPQGKYLSTNKAFWDGVKDKYDYVVNLPIEFFSENSDTMFSHAMFNFEHFPGFNRYEPVDYQDWSVPYTREFVIEGTHVIYNGLPVGRYNEPIVQAHVQALDEVLSKGVPARTASASVE